MKDISLYRTVDVGTVRSSRRHIVCKMPLVWAPYASGTINVMPSLQPCLHVDTLDSCSCGNSSSSTDSDYEK